MEEQNQQTQQAQTTSADQQQNVAPQTQQAATQATPETIESPIKELPDLPSESSESKDQQPQTQQTQSEPALPQAAVPQAGEQPNNANKSQNPGEVVAVEVSEEDKKAKKVSLADQLKNNMNMVVGFLFAAIIISVNTVIAVIVIATVTAEPVIDEADLLTGIPTFNEANYNLTVEELQQREQDPESTPVTSTDPFRLD